MKNPLLDAALVLVVGLIIGGVSTHAYYQRQIGLYQDRLRETLDEIHELSDEVDALKGLPHSHD